MVLFERALHTHYSSISTRLPEILDCSFQWGLLIPDFGEEEAVGGRGWYRSKERWYIVFYRPSIVTFPLSLRVSEILPLLFSSMPLFPYPTPIRTVTTSFKDCTSYQSLSTGWAKKRGHSAFCRIGLSIKLPKIFTRFWRTSRLVYIEYVYSRQV